MSLALPKPAKLYGRSAFKPIRDARVRHDAGCVTIHATPGAGMRSRLGISIGRPVGNAVVRNRIKRRIREAFRLCRDSFPAAYDLVISVRRHEPKAMQDYQELLARAIADLHKRWSAKR